MDFLFEIGLEELPSRYVDKAEADLKKITEDELKAERISFSETESFSTPRRVAVIIKNIAEKQEDLDKKSIGPSIEIAYKDGELTKAGEGFVKSQGAEKEDIKIIHSRAEIVSHDEKYRENFDLVVSRAVSSIENVIEYSSGFVKIGEHAILMRGKKEEYNKKYLEKFGFKEIIHESYKLFDEDRSIIILKKVKKLDSKLPSKTPKQKS